MRVVQNAVDLNRIDRMASINQAAHSDQFTIATVGLIDMKNPFTMLEAFRQSDDQSSKLIFIGEGKLRPLINQKVTESLRPLINQKVTESDLQQQVTTTGLIDRDEVFAYFGQADLFVSTSWGEGLPVAVMEAMACSLPVILSDIQPHREIAEGFDFIPLIKPDDVTGFAREIRKFREMPVSKRAAIGQKCRELIEERFSLPTMHAAYAEVYAQITGKQVLAPMIEIRELS
jgi:glycosyltransferase involved in cell wall biosynthesis